jgi:RNA polymerase sigma-70 factor (ECF subfamily)
MDGLSDEALLAGLGSGDPDAAVAFVRRFQGRVYGLALTMLHDRELADEVAQEAFVRAWRHAATFDARRGRVATWLLTIARNLAVDRGGLRSATPVDPDVVISELDRAGRVTIPDLGERECPREALTALPEDQRRALVLSVYAGRTAREIADVEHVPLGTAKTRIRTAILKLREALGAEHDL